MIRPLPLRQFVKFNIVGIAGTVVQLAMLHLCTRNLGMQYVFATALAVEIATLHNFAWHELWTWSAVPWRGWLGRLLRFQMGNGLTSIAGNTALTFAFHETFRLPVVAANLSAIAATALLNFALAKFWVLRAN
jgi:putative flippase GtrA